MTAHSTKYCRMGKKVVYSAELTVLVAVSYTLIILYHIHSLMKRGEIIQLTQMVMHEHKQTQ